jgi:hypothetical protein
LENSGGTADTAGIPYSYSSVRMHIGLYTLADKERARGVYVIGGSGSGKAPCF